MEEIFRSQFSEYTVEPSPGLWSKVQAKILWKQFFTFNLNHFNLYYLTAALTVAAGGILLITLRTPDQSELREQTKMEEVAVPHSAPEEITPALTEADQESENMPSQSNSQSSQGNEYPSKAEIQIKEEVLPSKKAEPESEKTLEATKLSIPDEETESGESETEIARIEFTSSRTSGCAPLAVDFYNASENAEKFLWNFGDGGSSLEENPSYVFDESGEYTVVLRMTGKNGLEYMKQQSIQVFETPSALFEVENDMNLQGPVYFYNYSKSAQYYEWDFGDRQRSGLTDPVHYYDQPGAYHVKLKVWTENQCFDSLVIYNAFDSEKNDILFPNAFTPNLSGPSSGYYNENDIGNTIFHPRVEGELLDYQLKIFNRIGVLLFETSDIQIGWDGYYQEELLPQDVYIWKSRGKFSNGQTFVKSGDVTLVRKY